MQTMKSQSLAASRGQALSLLIALVLVAPSCAKRDLRPLNPCTVSASSEELNVLPAEDIDLLFVVDNSGSMAEEQAALQAQIGVIVRTLIDQNEIDALIAANPDLEGAQAVKRLRVGTISSDFGVAGFGADREIAALNSMPLEERITHVVPNCGAYFGVDNLVERLEPVRANAGDRGVINLVPVSATIGDGEDAIACPASFPSFLSFDVEGSQSVEDFADDVSCTTVLGTSGCGFEMQLESLLAAITPSTSTAVEFKFGGGVADLPYPDGNAGFFRDEAILAIIMITDEDDCSTDNPEIFKRNSTELTDPDAPRISAEGAPYRFNTRCTRFDDGEQLYPVERYINGILAAKPANRLIFAGIVGVPRDIANSGAQSVQEIDAILASPEMEVRDFVVEGTNPPIWAQIPGTNVGSDSQVPACWRCLQNGVEDDSVEDLMDCTGAGYDLQYAVPASRILRVARGLAARNVITVFETICTDDFSAAIENILIAIISATKPSCLNRALNPDATGAVPCNVLERLPEGMHCDDLEGREPRPFKIDEDGRETCRLIQQVPTADDRAAGNAPAGLGWFYDDYTDETVVEQCASKTVKATVRFTPGTVPTPGATVRIDCLQPATAEKDINTPCASDATCHFDGDEEGQRALDEFVVRWNLDASRFTAGNPAAQPMSCEPTTNTCQIGCDGDADCPGGMVCSAEFGNFCVDPTCSVR